MKQSVETPVENQTSSKSFKSLILRTFSRRIRNLINSGTQMSVKNLVQTCLITCSTILLALVAGCGEIETSQNVGSNPVANPQAPPGSGPAIQENTAPKESRTVAKVGVGKKGRKPSGMIRVSTNAYFAAKEKIAFEIQIPKAMQLYKALHGSAPKSHKEFESKIIKANQIKLPQLPDGSRYEYDPSTEQLMVVKPEN